MAEALVLGTGIVAGRGLPRLWHCTKIPQRASALGITTIRSSFRVRRQGSPKMLMTNRKRP
jgi:hypothetical protein